MMGNNSIVIEIILKFTVKDKAKTNSQTDKNYLEETTKQNDKIFVGLKGFQIWTDTVRLCYCLSLSSKKPVRYNHRCFLQYAKWVEPVTVLQ